EIRQRQAAIRERQTAIRTELAAIEALPAPEEGDDATRSQALADRSASVDELADEFDTLTAEFGTLGEEAKPLQERADRLDRVRNAALDPVNREPATVGGNRAPAVHVQRDPFEGLDIQRADRTEVRERAMRLLEHEPEEVVSADNKGHIATQIRRSLGDA